MKNSKPKRIAEVTLNHPFHLQKGRALTAEGRGTADEYICRLQIGSAGIDAYVGKKVIGRWTWEGVRERLDKKNQIKVSN